MGFASVALRVYATCLVFGLGASLGSAHGEGAGRLPTSPHYSVVEIADRALGSDIHNTPCGLNRDGDVAGTVGPPDSRDTYAYLFTRGRFFKLGALGGKFSSAAAINDNGDVVGWAETARTSLAWRHQNERHAVLWRRGKTLDLGRAGEESEATGLNNAGDVVGTWETQGHGDNMGDLRGFLYSRGKRIDLGPLLPHGLNNHRQVIAARPTVSIEKHAVLYDGGRITSLDPPQASYTRAEEINDSGEVVGEFGGENLPLHGFVYRQGMITKLGTLGGKQSYALHVSRAGWVVGDSATRFPSTSGELGGVGGPDYGYQFHAFLYHNGKMIDIHGDHVAHELSHAVGLNDRGQVLGTYDGLQRPGGPACFIYDHGDRFNPLDRCSVGHIRHPVRPVRINDRGDILFAAYGELGGDLSRAYLLVSIPARPSDSRLPRYHQPSRSTRGTNSYH